MRTPAPYEPTEEVLALLAKLRGAMDDSQRVLEERSRLAAVKAETVRALRKQGLTLRRIAAETDTALTIIANLEKEARRARKEAGK